MIAPARGLALIWTGRRGRAHLCNWRKRELEIDGSGHAINELQLVLLLIALVLEGRSAVLRHQAVHLVLRLCVLRVSGVNDAERYDSGDGESCADESARNAWLKVMVDECMQAAVGELTNVRPSERRRSPKLRQTPCH